MSGALTALLGGVFTPITNIYTSGTGATETVPSGASQVVITMDSGGASGGFFGNVAAAGAGAGSGGCVKTIALVRGTAARRSPIRWPLQVPGARPMGRERTAISSVSGTVADGTVNLVGHGSGRRARSAGGTATGGDTNFVGQPG